MENSNRLFKFIVYGNFSTDNFNYIKSSLNRTNNQLIRDSFKILCSVAKDYNGSEYFDSIINNTIDFIILLCSNQNFDEEQLETNKLRIKKARKALLNKVNKYDQLIPFVNKLDEVILEKNIDVSQLVFFIKTLIDKQEDVNIIKKFINVNKEVIIKDTEIFDYIFNKAIDSIILNSRDIYYYITLLKITYTSKINKNNYWPKLACIEKNKFINEIYYIINGFKRPFDTSEILDKYNIISNIADYKIVSPYQKDNNNMIFTIDRERTYLRDDAISIRKDGNKYIVSIYIADAGTEIKYKSTTDEIAKNNFRCMYSPYKITSILNKGTENKLSLNQGKLRRAISLDVIVNDSGEIMDYNLCKHEIVVKNNFTYTEADKILNYLKQDDYYKTINELYMICKALELSNKSKKDYVEKKEKANGEKKINIYKSEVIITELMVLYNRIIATIAKSENFPYVYRTQEKEYITPLLNDLGIKINKRIKNIVNDLFLDSKYSTTPLYHAGLGFDAYSHSSDSLRRYPDLYNQYLLHEFYFKDLNGIYNEKEFNEMVNYFNQRNRELWLMKAEYERALQLTRK